MSLAEQKFYEGMDLYWDDETAEEAIAKFTEAIELDPYYADAYEKRGDCYYLNLPNYYISVAISDYTQAIKLTTDDKKLADLYHARAEAYVELENYEKAIEDLTQSIKLDPKNASYYRWRGRIYFKSGSYFDSGSYSAAISDFTKAIRIDPFAEVYLFRGLAYNELGEVEHAILDIKKALELKREDSEAWNL